MSNAQQKAPWAMVAATIFFLLLFSRPALGQECAKCHGPGGRGPAATLPDYSAHAGVDCAECHVSAETVPHELPMPAVNCGMCHGDMVRDVGGSSHGPGLKAYLEKAGKDKVKLSAICLSCHGNHDPHAIRKVSDPQSPMARAKVFETCGRCHPEQEARFEKSIHFKMLMSGDPDVPTCVNCHGAHNIYGKDDLRSAINQLSVDATCIKCHADQDLVNRHPDLPAPEFIRNYEDSVHGRGIHLKGLMVSASCISCHGEHDILPKSDPESKINHQNVPLTCGKCHAGILNDFSQSTHGKLWEAGNPKGPVCNTCHTSHKIQEPTARLFTTFEITKECQGCHNDRAATYGDTFHGKTTSMGFLVAAKCSDCHTPHHNLPASDPNSSVHPANLTKTCGKCHSGVTKNFTKYDPHPDPRDKKKSAFLFYMFLFMKLLLFGVFGFFGVHTLLWLQRSVVALVRKETEARFPLEGKKHVRRWSKTAVIMHIVLVSSFLGLVATGLPLRYHYTEWAKVLGSLYGGVEISRYIHRLCALITIGYASFHIFSLFRDILIKKEYGLLYGPDTLVPRWKDLIDIFDNLKYFFYLGPPPRFGKWTYYEKFDYFAVFWGVPVVVSSGLIMMFPTFFSQVLPGTFLNAASIVHSEEALLAAGFIFIFHFFHNHLRPGVIPMDINIFTGTMPLERLMKERPEEYERIHRENLIDQALIEPPEKRVMWESRMFGLVALSIGLFLIVAIILSFLFG